MAALAVLALGATLYVAIRALHEAEGTVVRGESDALLGAIARDFAEVDEPPTTDTLLRELAAYESVGLRYLAVVDRENVLAEAGSATMPGVRIHPGEVAMEDRRVRVLGPLMPPRRLGRRPPQPGRPGLIVVEFEPPVINQLRGDLTRISVVAAVAGVVLLGFAAAWSRNARRIGEIERRAAREERLISLGSMASVMAHELRNPLASLKGHAQLLVEDLEGGAPKPLQKAERVVSEAERLERLTSSLLDFVRDGPLERESLSTAELMARALQDLDATRVDLVLDTNPIDVDAARLARALHNVVDNALQADESGRVEVRVTSEGRDVVFTVRDHGPGIDASARLFEPFATTRVRGTGLGLAVVRRIAEQHGGSVAGENHPEGGAVFTLRIPKAQS